MFGGERGIRLSAIADRVRQRSNRVQLGDASAYPSFEDLSLRRQYNTSNIKKDNHLRLSYVWRSVSNVNRTQLYYQIYQTIFESREIDIPFCYIKNNI